MYVYTASYNIWFNWIINNIDQQCEFMDEIDLDRIITNDEDPEGHHVFIGTKNGWNKRI